MSSDASTATGQAASEFATEREFAIARDTMFQIWSECAHLKQWFSPKGYTMQECKNDFWPGGMFHYRLQAPDGSEMWGRWVYQEIAPPTRIVAITSFSDPQGGVTRHPLANDWPLKMLSRITFTPSGKNTTVQVQWSPYQASAAELQAFNAGIDGMYEGWNGTFELLENYLAKYKSESGKN